MLVHAQFDITFRFLTKIFEMNLAFSRHGSKIKMFEKVKIATLQYSIIKIISIGPPLVRKKMQKITKIMIFFQVFFTEYRRCSVSLRPHGK